MNSRAIHQNLEERSDNAAFFERGGKSFIFVAGPALVLLVFGWLLGIVF